jgi:hypothetical protein
MSAVAEAPPKEEAPSLKDFKPPELAIDKDGLPVVPDNPFGELDKIRDQLPESREETPEPRAQEPDPVPEPAGNGLPDPEPEPGREETSDLDSLLTPIESPEDAEKLIDQLEKSAPEDNKQANKWYRKAISGVQEKHSKEIEGLRAELSTMEKKLEEERAALEARRSEFEQQELEYAAAVPDSHPEIKKIRDGLDQRWDDTLKGLAMAADDPSRIQMISGAMGELVKAYDSLDRNAPNFTETRNAIKERVDEIAGEGVFQQLQPFLHEASGTMKLIESKSGELQGKASEAAYQREKNHWDSIEQRVAKITENWGKVPEDIQKTNPFSPDAIIQQFSKEVPEFAERLDKLKEKLPEYHMPLPPVDPAEVSTMSPEDRDAYLAAREKRESEHLDVVIGRSYKHFALEMVTPLLAKKLRDQQEVIDSLTANEPVPAAGGAEGNHGGADEPKKEMTVSEVADQLASPEAFEKYMAGKGYAADQNSQFGLR